MVRGQLKKLDPLDGHRTPPPLTYESREEDNSCMSRAYARTVIHPVMKRG